MGAELSAGAEMLAVARRFAAEHVEPNAAAWERDRHFPRETIRAAAAEGLCGLLVPRADGIEDTSHQGCLALDVPVGDRRQWLVGDQQRPGVAGQHSPGARRLEPRPPPAGPPGPLRVIFD